MKKNIKILIGFIILLIIAIVFLIIKTKPINNDNLLKNENNPGINIIQAKLIDASDINYVDVANLYEGMLTFENLNNSEQHTYFVCLEDLSDVKLNDIYDLPANYYLPHGGPNESMETNGCNGPLHISNKNYLENSIKIDEGNISDNKVKESNVEKITNNPIDLPNTWNDPKGEFSFKYPDNWIVNIEPERIVDNFTVRPAVTNVKLSSKDTNLLGDLNILTYGDFSSSNTIWEQEIGQLGDSMGFGINGRTMNKSLIKIDGFDAIKTTLGYAVLYPSKVSTQKVLITVKTPTKFFEIMTEYTVDQKSNIDGIIKSVTFKK